MLRNIVLALLFLLIAFVLPYYLQFNVLQKLYLVRSCLEPSSFGH